VALAHLDINRALQIAQMQAGPEDQEAIDVMESMTARRLSVEPEQTRFAALCDRFDNLYYPQAFTKGGASHWADDESAWQDGRTHVSVNNYPTYVDIPAALQAFQPVENMLALGGEDADRAIASEVERVYLAWKAQTDFEMLCQKACVTKGLYGRTAAKIFWDKDDKFPHVELIDQPRNLYLGWKDSSYTRLEWALYSYSITPDTAMEDWGLIVERGMDAEGKPYPYVVSPIGGQYTREPFGLLRSADLRVEVNDYWYRKPRKNARIEAGKPVKFETWNAVFVGNVMVKNKMHSEYRGLMPYVPLMNSYLPGMPEGKSNLYDVEQLQREKDERISENAQMIHRAISGQYWQLVGPEAPLTVPAGLRPQPNQVIGPGPGNRIEALQPWMPEFQMEQYLARVDRELTDISGLNDLMRGMAPSSVMSSGKAISALVSNYETRISMPRGLYYKWRQEIWNLVAQIWAEKNPDLRDVIEGKTYLDLKAPSLTPRDDAEQAQIASNLKEMKLWSAVRAMDRVGVDDPETEQNIIRAEQTDATLNPAQVQVMVSLMLMMQQLQQQMPQGLPQQAQQAQMSTEEAMASMRGLAPQTTGEEMMNGQGEQPMTPGEQMPGNTEIGAEMGAGGAMAPQAVDENGNPVDENGNPMPSQMLNQFQIQGGEVNNRVIGQQQIQKQE
jgi:hypothetical protein